MSFLAFEGYFIVISNSHFYPNSQGKGGYKHPIYVKIRILNNSYTVYRSIQTFCRQIEECNKW